MQPVSEARHITILSDGIAINGSFEASATENLCKLSAASQRRYALITATARLCLPGLTRVYVSGCGTATRASSAAAL